MPSAASREHSSKESRMTFLGSREAYNDVYQKVYTLRPSGPNNYDFGVGLTYVKRGKIQTVKFSITREDGHESSLEVCLTLLRDIGQDLEERELWEFEGILWHHNLHAKKEGSRIIRPLVKGHYNTHSRHGRLYVLAHDQPRPPVEVVTWKEVFVMINAVPRSCIEFKHQHTGDLSRGSIIACTQDDSGVLTLTFPDILTSTEAGWKQRGISSYDIPTESSQCSVPVVLADGRILFTLGDIDCIIYFGSV